MRQEGKACEVCGSDDLACDYGAIRNAAFGSVLVRLYCNDRGAHTNGVVGIEQPLFALDDNDAHRIGII